MTTLTPQVDSSYITLKLTPNQAYWLYRMAVAKRDELVATAAVEAVFSGTDANSLNIALQRLSDGLVRHQSEYGQ